MKMIQHISVQDLLQESVYEGTRTGTYFDDLSFLESHAGAQAVADYVSMNPSRASTAAADLLWWTMDQAYPFFCRATEILPRHWLAHSMYAYDTITCLLTTTIGRLALAILSWFDLDRYRISHSLDGREYDLMSQDLTSVLDQLESYPKERLAAPWPEDEWGLG